MIFFPRLVAVSIWIFFFWISTGTLVHAQVTVFEETFDLAGDPAGWSLEDGWSESTSTPSPGSGTVSLQHSGSAQTSASTPQFSLSAATSASFSYLARRTGAYATENLRVSVSADGGATFPFTLLEAGVAVPGTDSKWESMSASLPVDVIGSSEVVIRFEGQGLNSANSNVRIDDVTVAADVPVSVLPSALGFEAAVGAADVKTVDLMNHTTEAITVGAPSLLGMAFAIEPSGPIVLAAGLSQTYAVTFSPDARGIVSGSVRFDYGTGQVEVNLTGTATGGVLGFATEASEIIANSAEILAVPLRLSFDATVGLQALQFRVAWMGDELSVSGLERGEAVSDEGVWTLSFEVGAGFVDVVLIGNDALLEGTYDNLLHVHFGVLPVESMTETLLSVQNVIGALAVPEGVDADVSASTAGHLITISPGQRNFEPSPETLDFGLIPVGDIGTTLLTVSNPGGNDTLEISHVVVSNPLFDISPTSAAIAPEESEVFTVSFAPQDTSFGRQNGEIAFTHTGEGQADTISVTAKGIGGRGDVDSDGTVDILDLVHSIDFILNRLIPDDLQEAAADLYPFPEGDAALDVRDLTVLLRAIVSGAWPDGVDLPLEEAETEDTGPSGIWLTADPGRVELMIGRPIRAAQIVLPASEGAFVDLDASDAGITIDSGNDDSAGELRVLIYRQDGSSIQPGAIHIATQGVLGRPRYVTVIGDDRSRLPLDSSVWTSIESPPDVHTFDHPYPNPFRVGTEALIVPTGASPAEVRIYDVLGRTIMRQDQVRELFEWAGTNASGRHVAAGIYIIEVSTPDGREIHTIQAVR